MTTEYSPALQRLRDVAVAERPQERLEQLGPGALSDTELLAMLLRSGGRGNSVLGLSARLVSEAGSLAGLLGWSESDFRGIKGIGPVKSLQLIAVMEVARRVLRAGSGAAPDLGTPADVFAYLRPTTSGLEVEKFWVLALNRKNRLLKFAEVTSGTATGSLAHPREVFREAIRRGAAAIICAHNHPSGDPTPSRADIRTTRQLREAAQTIGIDLLDHIIVGDPRHDPSAQGFYSFAEAGVL